MADFSETLKRLESDPQGGAQYVIELLETFFQPLLLMLDRVLDKRLVRTMHQCLTATIRLRYRLRWALSRLWDDYRPQFTCFIPSSSDPLAVCSLVTLVERVQKNWG